MFVLECSLFCDESEAANQGLEAPERAGFEAIAGARAVDLAADEADVFQDLEVLRHGGLRQRQLLDDVAADAGVSTRQQAHDLDPYRVAERPGEGGQIFVRGVALHGPQIGLVGGR